MLFFSKKIKLYVTTDPHLLYIIFDCCIISDLNSANNKVLHFVSFK